MRKAVCPPHTPAQAPQVQTPTGALGFQEGCGPRWSWCEGARPRRGALLLPLLPPGVRRPCANALSLSLSLSLSRGFVLTLPARTPHTRTSPSEGEAGAKGTGGQKRRGRCSSSFETLKMFLTLKDLLVTGGLGRRRKYSSVAAAGTSRPPAPQPRGALAWHPCGVDTSTCPSVCREWAEVGIAGPRTPATCCPGHAGWRDRTRGCGSGSRTQRPSAAPPPGSGWGQLLAGQLLGKGHRPIWEHFSCFPLDTLSGSEKSR